MLKRFEDNELGESASRRVSYHCTADYAKSSRAQCRVCNEKIEQGELRLALMLQDDEGYKNTAWTHFDCFWTHPETKKLSGTQEIHLFSKLKPADQRRIATGLTQSNATKSTKKRFKSASREDEESDDDFSLTSQRATRSTRTKSTSSKKRKA